MTKTVTPRPEPTTGTNYSIYLAPRSKEPAMDALYLRLIELGWRFDTVTTTWWTPESETYGAHGRLEYAADYVWARIQPPNPGPDSEHRAERPLLQLRRVDGEWLVVP